MAKAIEGETASIDVSTSPTISHMATQAGIILGTAAYMSPEQAKGKSVDRRADIWSFGCVVLEMLSGKITFGGETVTDTLAAIVLKEPDWSQLPASTPSAIKALLQRCLRKDPRQRLQGIGDARVVIEEVLTPGGMEETARTPGLNARSTLWSIVAGIIFVLSIASLVTWFFWPKISRNQNGNLTAAIITAKDLDDPAISPDGRSVAFEDQRKIWLRNLGELEPKALAGTENGTDPFWSPDSKSIGYFQNGELRRISTQGGPSTLICKLIDRQFPPATWGADDRIIIQDEGGLFEVPDLHFGVLSSAQQRASSTGVV